MYDILSVILARFDLLPLQIRGYLESCRNERDEQGGPLTTEGGELIMEEREYQAITQLKQVRSTTKLCDCTG